MTPQPAAAPEIKSSPMGEVAAERPEEGQQTSPSDDDDALFVEPSVAEGLRPRLRLTPTASDEEFKTVFDTAAGRVPAAPAPKEHESLTWKDLLSSIDESPIEDEQLADRMIADIEGLGVDASALLPRARVEELAVIAAEDDRRAAVRGLAPAAVRRLSRRLFTDRAFRIHTERYVRRYGGLLADAAKRDPQGFMTVTLLGSDEGRAFLLLDAASADFG